MGKDKTEKTAAEAQASIEATLLALARPKMTPKELLKAAKRAPRTKSTS